jgi:hypothetical protein
MFAGSQSRPPPLVDLALFPNLSKLILRRFKGNLDRLLVSGASASLRCLHISASCIFNPIRFFQKIKSTLEHISLKKTKMWGGYPESCPRLTKLEVSDYHTAINFFRNTAKPCLRDLSIGLRLSTRADINAVSNLLSSLKNEPSLGLRLLALKFGADDIVTQLPPEILSEILELGHVKYLSLSGPYRFTKSEWLLFSSRSELRGLALDVLDTRSDSCFVTVRVSHSIVVPN